MGKLSRIRPSRLKPLPPKRRRELDALLVKFAMKIGKTAKIERK